PRHRTPTSARLLRLLRGSATSRCRFRWGAERTCRLLAKKPRIRCARSFPTFPARALAVPRCQFRRETAIANLASQRRAPRRTLTREISARLAVADRVAHAVAHLPRKPAMPDRRVSRAAPPRALAVLARGRGLFRKGERADVRLDLRRAVARPHLIVDGVQRTVRPRGLHRRLAHRLRPLLECAVLALHLGAGGHWPLGLAVLTLHEGHLFGAVDHLERPGFAVRAPRRHLRVRRGRGLLFEEGEPRGEPVLFGGQ